MERINSYVCLDLETTGLDPKKNKIIEETPAIRGIKRIEYSLIPAILVQTYTNSKNNGGDF